MEENNNKCKSCNDEKDIKFLEYCSKCMRELNKELDDIKEKGFFSKIWNKTIFADMIKAKKEEKAIKRQIQREAKKEALLDMHDELKEHYKQEELNKIKGIKKSGSRFFEKLTKGFEGIDTNKTFNTGLSSDKIANMMGNFGNQTETKTIEIPIKKGKYKGNTKKVQVNKVDNFEERMKKIIG